MPDMVGMAVSLTVGSGVTQALWGAGGERARNPMYRVSRAIAQRYVRVARNDDLSLFREPVRPALLNAAPKRGARMHPRHQPQVRIRPELLEHFRHVADKAHLDIRAGQALPTKNSRPFSALST